VLVRVLAVQPFEGGDALVVQREGGVEGDAVPLAPLAGIFGLTPEAVALRLLRAAEADIAVGGRLVIGGRGSFVFIAGFSWVNYDLSTTLFYKYSYK
jgi:hypothetical protein